MDLGGKLCCARVDMVDQLRWCLDFHPKTPILAQCRAPRRGRLQPRAPRLGPPGKGFAGWWVPGVPRDMDGCGSIVAFMKNTTYVYMCNPRLTFGGWGGTVILHYKEFVWIVVTKWHLS